MKWLRLLFISLLTVACFKKPKEDVFTRESDVLSDSSSLRLRAEQHYRKNEYQDAISGYSALLRIDSLNGQFYYRRAYSYLQTDSFSNAITDFEKSILLGYKVPQSYFAMGSIYTMDVETIRNDSLAILYFERCLAIDPSFEKARVLLKHLYTNKQRL